jgi:hypothetical protein
MTSSRQAAGLLNGLWASRMAMRIKLYDLYLVKLFARENLKIPGQMLKNQVDSVFRIQNNFPRVIVYVRKFCDDELHNEVIMSDIKKEEMFGNLKGFLKSKGIDIQEGSYAEGIRKGCEILTDTVNMSQRALERTKDAVDQGLEKARQTVHEYTAPKTKPGSPKTTASADSQTQPKSAPKKNASAKTKKPSSARGKKRG